MTVIDGSSGSTTTVAVGTQPVAVAVNPVTNKIYVANSASNNLTVIDGVTNATTSVSGGNAALRCGSESGNNKIYIANSASNNVTVIDGQSGGAINLPGGTFPDSVAVNPVTNKIYVANKNSNTVTIIDANANTSATVTLGASPQSVAVNPMTNQIYVASLNGNLTVIDGASNAAATVAVNGAAIVANPLTNKIYVANTSSNTVAVIDGATNATATIPAGANPYSVAMNPVTNTVYSANSASANVTVIDGASNLTIPVATGSGPISAAVNPVTNKIYVANEGSNTVTTIDGVTHATAVIPVGRLPVFVAVNPVTSQIYVANQGTDNVTVIDGTTNNTSNVPVGGLPVSLAVNTLTNQIYVANEGSGDITVIDGASNSVTNLATGSFPVAVAVNPLTNKIYVANQASGDVTVIDGTSYSSATVIAGLHPSSLAVNPITNKIYVANIGDGVNASTVTVIDGATNNTATVAVGVYPYSVAVNYVTNKIYVANSDSSSVTVIDGATNSVSTVAAGAGAQSLAVNPATNKIYVANYTDGTVTVIDEEQVEPIPLTTGITPLPNNQTNSPAPSFTFTTTSTTVTTPQNVFFQVDTWQNPWTAATGSNPSFAGTVASLQPGFHILYAYATDGQNVGSVQAYGFLVTAAAAQQSQIITFGTIPNQNVGTQLTLTASASSGLPVSFSSATTSVCIVSGITASFITSGSCTIIASQSGNSTYPPATPVSQTFQVVSSSQILFSQTITFNPIATQKVGTPLTLTATATSNLPVSYTSSTLNVCTVSGTTASFIATGTCTITASQAGNSTYQAATPVSQSFLVNSSTSPTALQFVPVTPCRVVDTRWANSSFGGPEMASGSARSFFIPNSTCGIPPNAAAYSLNVTAVPDSSLRYLAIWPSGQAQPVVSTLNSDGRVKANAAIVPAGTNGGVAVFVSDPSHVILDINGYFVAGNSSALEFYPLIPCRIADTRSATGPLGGPFLSAGVARTLSVVNTCAIPPAAQAYSFNFTAIPHVPLGYLSTWPAGQPQPLVSTLNASTGAVTANAAIVPAGTNGAISVYASNDSDLAIDVNGYFAAPGSGGLSLYNVTPCRALDTRSNNGDPIVGILNFNISATACNVPVTASAVVLNVTVVPPGDLRYLSLWATGTPQPVVSTLNASDGAVTSNMAIVPATNGSVGIFPTDPTHLILDTSGYFAP